MSQKYRQHRIYPKEFPESWASGWGEDEYGIWMEFTYKGVVQRFRWCEPGAFLMGSPEDEPERQDNETQHEVILSRGFWIADTTVTQSLWETVMGKNPSSFKGENRPVEKVSWDDAQAFMDKMNDMKPKLMFQLPTEAQWEYACRAGSETPFCWGGNISSDFVNFQGTVPYNNGEKSEYRAETVDVESFYQNDWGLWQMHGNVDEWCQDWFGEYPAQLVVDPMGPEFGSDRVLRGGNWMNVGWACRSAFRSWNFPSVRYHSPSIGFRIARQGIA